MKALKDMLKNNNIRIFLKCLFLMLLLFISIASVAFRIILMVESKPFFYVNFWLTILKFIMDTVIIILINLGIPAVIILFVFLFIRRKFAKNKKFADELRQKIANARPANAKVLSASQGIVGGSIKRLIFLKLEINDGFGQNYEAEAAWFVDTLHFDKIKEGSFFSVKVNSENKSIIYPGESWAVYTEGYGKELSVENFAKPS